MLTSIIIIIALGRHQASYILLPFVITFAPLQLSSTETIFLKDGLTVLSSTVALKLFWTLEHCLVTPVC